MKPVIAIIDSFPLVLIQHQQTHALWRELKLAKGSSANQVKTGPGTGCTHETEILLQPAGRRPGSAQMGFL